MKLTRFHKFMLYYAILHTVLATIMTMPKSPLGYVLDGIVIVGWGLLIPVVWKIE